MSGKEETLRKIEEFNKRAEELKKSDIATPPAPPSLSPEAQELLKAPEGTLTPEQQLQKQAEITSSDIAKDQREREIQESAREVEEGKAIDRVSQSSSDFVESALDKAQPTIRWLENVPTPTGLGVLLGVIVIFLLAVVPVNSAGDTRLKLLYYVLSGKAQLKPQSPSFGGGAGGTIPTSSTSPQNVPVDLSNINIPDLSGLDFLG